MHHKLGVVCHTKLGRINKGLKCIDGALFGLDPCTFTMLFKIVLSLLAAISLAEVASQQQQSRFEVAKHQGHHCHHSSSCSSSSSSSDNVCGPCKKREDKRGLMGPAGPQGSFGAVGPQGNQGPVGPTGTEGAGNSDNVFFALRTTVYAIPSNNAPVQFDSNPIKTAGFTFVTPGTSITLVKAGTYSFQWSIDNFNGASTYLFFSDTSIGTAGSFTPQSLFNDQSNYEWQYGQAIVTVPADNTTVQLRVDRNSVTLSACQFVIQRLTA